MSPEIDKAVQGIWSNTLLEQMQHKSLFFSVAKAREPWPDFSVFLFPRLTMWWRQTADICFELRRWWRVRPEFLKGRGLDSLSDW